MYNDWACVQQLLLPSAKLNSFSPIDMRARQEGRHSFCVICQQEFLQTLLSPNRRFCLSPSGLFRLTANALASHFLQNYTAEGTDYSYHCSRDWCSKVFWYGWTKFLYCFNNPQTILHNPHTIVLFEDSWVLTKKCEPWYYRMYWIHS